MPASPREAAELDEGRAVTIAALLAGAAMLLAGTAALRPWLRSLLEAWKVPTHLAEVLALAVRAAVPRLLVGAAALQSAGEAAALGCLLGGPVAVLTLGLGLAAVVRPLRRLPALRHSLVAVFMGSTFLLLLVLVDGEVALLESSLLVAVPLAWFGWLAHAGTPPVSEARAGAAPSTPAGGRGAPPTRHELRRSAVLGIAGVAVAWSGARIATTAALALGATRASDRVVGLTLLAVASSLPDLAGIVRASQKADGMLVLDEVAIALVAGGPLTLGMFRALGPLRARPDVLLPELMFLCAVTFLVLLLLRTLRAVRRLEGALLVGLYAGFVWLLLRR